MTLSSLKIIVENLAETSSSVSELMRRVEEELREWGENPDEWSRDISYLSHEYWGWK